MFRHILPLTALAIPLVAIAVLNPHIAYAQSSLPQGRAKYWESAISTDSRFHEN
jgi:hypothetical protein